LVRKFELPDAFPLDVDAEAAPVAPRSRRRLGGPRTFFDRRVVTIDGADAKDFDDAVSLERLPDRPAGRPAAGGWECT